MSVVRARLVPTLALLLPVLAAILLRLPYLDVPLERDEGEYAYIAWRMGEGDVPYRDAFDQKPPGIFAVYWLAFLLLGPDAGAARTALLVSGALTTAVVALIGRRLAGSPGALISGLAFALLSTSPSLWATAANTEIFMLLPLALAVVVLYGTEPAPLTSRPSRLLLAGFLIGTAFLLKQVGILLALALLPELLARRRFRDIGLLASGGTCVVALSLLPFALAGALPQALDCILLHNLRYSGSGCAEDAFSFLGSVLSSISSRHGPLLLLAGWGTVKAATRRAPLDVLALGWLFFALLGTLLGCRFFPHYFLAVVPPTCLLAARGVTSLGKPGTGARRVILAVSATLILVFPLVQDRKLLSASPDDISRSLYGMELFPLSRTLARRIELMTAPADPVLVVGSEPQILFHARRRSATRYIFFYPLTSATAFARDRQAEMLAEIRQLPPAAILWVRVPFSLGIEKGGSVEFLDDIRKMLPDYALDSAVVTGRTGLMPVLGPDSVRSLPRALLEDSAALLYLRRPSPD